MQVSEPTYEHVIFPCGCWFERKSPDEFAFQVCTTCWDSKLEMLTKMSLDAGAQLTLPLASERERHGSTDNG